MIEPINEKSLDTLAAALSYAMGVEAPKQAAEVIAEDKYDFIVVYNGNYDHFMHMYGPEGVKSLGELCGNAQAFALFTALIEKHWGGHNSLVGFAMDHGCHEIDGHCGSHGLDMPEDLNIVHLYKAYPKRGAETK